MSRTTINIDDPVLRDLKRLQREDGRSLGRLVSDLLAEALAKWQNRKRKARPFCWVSKPMHARLDLSDKDAVWRTLDEGAKRIRKP